MADIPLEKNGLNRQEIEAQKTGIYPKWEELDDSGKQEIYDYLTTFVTDNRKELFERILNNRTRHIAVVLEDIYQTHNASAVVRSCDCFGIQDLHVIENSNKYTVNPAVTMGSSKWVDIKRYGRPDYFSTPECLNQLKEQGYRIVATTPHKDDILIGDLDLSKPFALLFGTEIDGLTKEALELADEYVKIPQVGFTESFNISVSAALCLYETTNRLWKSDVNWHLSEIEKRDLRYRWIKKTIRRSAMLEEEYWIQKKL